MLVRYAARVDTMTDAHDSVRRKVSELFVELAGDRAKQLDGAVIARASIAALSAALEPDYGAVTAANVAMHLADWNSDAAFLVALHLFPERFTNEEIRAGVGLFLVHAPNHIREACRLTGQYVWEDFPDDDEGAA
jgi:hypothetical protein